MPLDRRSLALLLLVGCGQTPTPDAGVPSLPKLTDAVTTEQKTLTAANAVFSPALTGPSSTPLVMAGWVDAGYGAELEQAGEAPMPQVPPMMAMPPAPGAHPKRLVRFVHLADTQL